MTLQAISPGMKLVISIIWDFLDFTVGRIPVFGTFFDLIGGVLAVLLWGGIGAIAFIEVIDITDQFDAQIPILTLCGIFTLARGGR